MAQASAVVTRARDQLVDLSSTGYHWTDPELLRWLSDAQREVCTFYPEANTQTAAITPNAADYRIDLRLRAGSTPIAILRFAGQGDNGEHEVKLVERHVLDSLDPEWMGRVPTNSSGPYYKAVVLDPKDPLSFWMYPRANPAKKIHVTFTAVPAELAATSDNLALPDQFIPMLVDYVCYRALAKDSVYTGAPNKAGEFLQAFNTKLALASGRQADLAPPAARAPNEH